NIKVTDLKLGPKDVTTYDIALDDLNSFSNYRVVNINYHGVDERWKLYIIPTDVKVSITSSDVRANYATLTAAGEANDQVGFRYRVLGESQWLDSNEEIIIENGQFSTIIDGLMPSTAYEFIAYSGSDNSEILTQTTESILDLPNSDLEQWSFPSTYNGVNNKSWFPFLEDGEQYWGSGNQGATTLGDSFNLTTPTEDIRPGSVGVKAASLQSRNTLKFATGSIFTGSYIKTAGTNGIIGLGRPFTSRPEGLKGWMKYNCGVIDMVGTIPPGVEIIKGETLDQGSIFIALGTWDAATYGVSSFETTSLGTEQSPMIIDTRDSATFFNKNSEDIVAYGELIISESIDQWCEFSIDLTYRTLEIVPTHIIIVCSASRYGDYFTGSSKSLMLLDDLSLTW
ncbi:MAG: PCMD domain-containing protein, partial [Rikenellaceae bacterium]